MAIDKFLEQILAVFGRPITRRQMLRGGLMGATGLLLPWLSSSCTRQPTRESPPVSSTRIRKGGTDVTFLAAADTHCGASGIDAALARQVEHMNAIVGRPYPDEIGDGIVAQPLGVLMAGDLTDAGLPGQFNDYKKLFGHTGKDALMKFPVFECSGNHDRLNPFSPVMDFVRANHGGLLYSWDWQDVHVICLDEYPNAKALDWLRTDLAAVGQEVPVVIYFHYNLAGPFSDYWSAAEKAAFRKAVEGFNVVGVFHGHWHSSAHYQWEGLDVYMIGSAKHNMHRFLVAHITDGRLTVAAWDFDRGSWDWTHTKEINSAIRRWGVQLRPLGAGLHV
jgi:cytolysin (calcineurin-like family phosphatase)